MEGGLHLYFSSSFLGSYILAFHWLCQKQVDDDGEGG